jgi:hypothetical protein
LHAQEVSLLFPFSNSHVWAWPSTFP